MPRIGADLINFQDDAPAFEARSPIDLSENIKKIQDLPDGSSIYETIDDESEEQKDDVIEEFTENLAESIPDNELSLLAVTLLDGIQDDRDSREQWEHSITQGMKYMGIKIQEFKDYPFSRSCSAYDSTLSTSIFRAWSTARAELLPSSGPARDIVYGEPNEELEAKGMKVKRLLNHYLTIIDKEYYPDFERMLLYVVSMGCAFKKVYLDPITNHPKSRFIDPQDFIVNNKCKTLLSSDRITNVLYLSKKEIIQRQMSGIYSDDCLPEINEDSMEESETTKTVKKLEGISTEKTENKSLFTFYEVHADLDLKGFEHTDKKSNLTGMPLPYIVTICATNKKIVAIRRNWKDGDKNYVKISWFIKYGYLPGFGLYDLGLMHIVGSNAIALTSILRQLIDAGTLRNFPGGLKQKGLRVENNDKAIGPSEFWDIETGGQPIQDAIMLMPYNEPSLVLKELRKELIQETQQLAGTIETQISESSSETPVGTILAQLEVANKVQSSVMRSMHTALSNELQLIYDLFKEGMGDEGYEFDVEGASHRVTTDDFHERLRIVPVSDPNLCSSTQRILRSEAILRLAQSAPQLHDMRNAYHRMYMALNIEDIDKLLPPEKEAIPLDPITENMNAMENKPLKAAIWQDHPAHMASHAPLIDKLMQSNPEAADELRAHNRTHEAMQYLIEMQQAMQIQMPDLETLLDPEIQNKIAMMAAQAAQMKAQEDQQKNPPPIDPNQVMLLDIEARREAAALKNEEAKLRAETESFKAQLKFESEKDKLEGQLEMAENKNETDIDIAEMKLTQQSTKETS